MHVGIEINSSAFRSGTLKFPVLAHGLWLPCLASSTVCEDPVPRDSGDKFHNPVGIAGY